MIAPSRARSRKARETVCRLSASIGARGVPVLHPGYREPGRYSEGPGITPDGLRARVGAVHLPLEDLLQAFLDVQLTLERFEEHGDAT